MLSLPPSLFGQKGLRSRAPRLYTARHIFRLLRRAHVNDRFNFYGRRDCKYKPRRASGNFSVRDSQACIYVRFTRSFYALIRVVLYSDRVRCEDSTFRVRMLDCDAWE